MHEKTFYITNFARWSSGPYAQGVVRWADYTAHFGITIWSPQNDPSVQLQGNTAIDYPTAGTVGIGPGVNQYNGFPIGVVNDSLSSEGIYGNGNLWTVALYAAPGINNTAGVLAAEAVNAYSGTAIFSTTGGTGVGNAGQNGTDGAGSWNTVNPALPVARQLLGYGPAGAGQTAAPNALYSETKYSSSATVQLLVWYNGGGSLSYAQAEAAGDPYGASSFESINPLGLIGNPPSIIPDLGQNLVSGDGVITSFSLDQQVIPEPGTIALSVIGASVFLLRRREKAAIKQIFA